ncbi:MAG TPA: prephenate dehydrogenase/arogenate dehydrogenase family protein [Gemmatimonadaceae bacterium]|nr:prephenate dehydrogenase/arogenate dehydrogenase family protein [Gemmatimonadaceae bacterium]
MKVAIVGLGLIGGSLARDLSTRGHTVLACDRSRDALRKARRAGAIAGVLPPDLAGIEEADVCVIALPVDATRTVLAAASARLAGLPAVTDVGSTKASIVRAAATAGLTNFVGSHPMAGGHDSGWSASRSGIFEGKCVYLTAPAGASPAAVRLVRRLWRTVGGRLTPIDAREHDRLLAATSHLPQVVALALAAVYAEAGIARGVLGRGGREMTRLAASNGAMWSAIFTDHPRNVAARIRRLRKTLASIERDVVRKDGASIRRLMARTNGWARR